MAQTHKKEEIYNGVSTSDVPSAQWGWSGMSKRSLQIAGWISVLFLLGMLFGNHPGNVENIWLVAIAALFAIGLLWHAFSPQGKQVRTVTAHNKAAGHVEPDWSADQLNGTGAYANLTDSQMASCNHAPGTYGAAAAGAAGGQTSMTAGIPNEDEDKGRVTRA